MVSPLPVTALSMRCFFHHVWVGHALRIVALVGGLQPHCDIELFPELRGEHGQLTSISGLLALNEGLLLFDDVLQKLATYSDSCGCAQINMT